MLCYTKFRHNFHVILEKHGSGIIVCFRAQAKNFLPFCHELNGKKKKKKLKKNSVESHSRKIENGKIGNPGLMKKAFTDNDNRSR